MDADRARVRCQVRHLAALAFAVAGVLSLSGCGGGSVTSGPLLSTRIFGGTPKMAISPLIGAPPNVAQELTQALVVAGQNNGLSITPGTAGGGAYTLRGYLIATPEKRGSKISYIWDVSDSKGSRVTRVSGDEIIDTRRGSDPWSAADSAAINRIATSSASKLSASLGGRSSAPPVAASAPAATPSASGTTTTAARPSAPTGPAMALVPPVSGAPGDGEKSLTTAIKKRLNAGGVKLATSAGGNVYTVKGVVSLTDAGGGKQSIRIDWVVLNPNGSKRGTVSQQNTIPRGSLSGPWGAIADAAAADAAKGIIKLLPSSRT